MEDILKKANELGLLIYKTDTAVNFREMESRVKSDTEASLLLEKYNELAEMIRLKQESGFKIESYEAAEFSEITASVTSNSLLRDYIKSRDSYMNMLLKINNELSM